MTSVTEGENFVIDLRRCSSRVNLSYPVASDRAPHVARRKGDGTNAFDHHRAPQIDQVSACVRSGSRLLSGSKRTIGGVASASPEPASAIRSKFTPDSPLEGAGFERSVPHKIATVWRVSGSFCNTRQTLSQERDRGFESAFLQR